MNLSPSFAIKSLILDWKFLQATNWSFARVCEFLIKKYWALVKHTFAPVVPGKDFVTLGGIPMYYDMRIGITDYERVLARHQKMIRDAGIREASCVLDVGANLGTFSLMCRGLFPNAAIYCLEPIPQTFEILQKNVQGDSLTKAFQVAVSDHEGTAKMSFDEANTEVSRFSDSGPISVGVTTLDRFCEREGISQIDILNIDTETFEAHVLRGARGMLARTKYLYLEVTIDQNEQYTISSLFSLLYSDEFDFQLVSFRNFAERSQGPMPIMDVLLVNKKFGSV